MTLTDLRFGTICVSLICRRITLITAFRLNDIFRQINVWGISLFKHSVDNWKHRGRGGVRCGNLWQIEPIDRIETVAIGANRLPPGMNGTTVRACPLRTTWRC